MLYFGFFVDPVKETLNGNSSREITFSPTGWHFQISSTPDLGQVPWEAWVLCHRPVSQEARWVLCLKFSGLSNGDTVTVCCVPAELPPVVWAGSVTYSVLH